MYTFLVIDFPSINGNRVSTSVFTIMPMLSYIFPRQIGWNSTFRSAIYVVQRTVFYALLRIYNNGTQTHMRIISKPFFFISLHFFLCVIFLNFCRLIVLFFCRYDISLSTLSTSAKMLKCSLVMQIPMALMAHIAFISNGYIHKGREIEKKVNEFVSSTLNWV